MSAKHVSGQAVPGTRIERSKLCERVLSELLNTGMVALCAGPGMGKSWLAHELIRLEKERGSYCITLKLKKPMRADPEKPPLEKLRASLARVQRSVKRHAGTGQSCIVLCDEVSSFDEYELQLVVPALERLKHAGCSILFCLRPEATQLLDELEAIRFTAPDLQIGSDELEQAFKGRRGVSVREVLELTGGVPALVSAVCAAGATDVQDIQESPAFISALSTYCLQLLRSDILEDERRLRMTLCLLGSGSMSWLEALPLTSSPELLASLTDESPFFGFEPLTGRFSCAALVHDATFTQLSSAAKKRLSIDTELLDACMGLMEHQDNLLRALALAQLRGEDTAKNLILRHGPSYLDLGYKCQVEDVLSKLDDTSANSFEAQLTRASYACLEADDKSYLAFYGELGAPHTAAQTLLLSQLAAARLSRLATQRYLCGLTDDGAPGTEEADLLAQINPRDALSARLLIHARTLSRISEGRLEEALGMLLSTGDAHEPQSLSACLLCDDLEISRYLMGAEIHRYEAQRAQSVGSFLARGDYHDQLAYHADLLSLVHNLRSGLIHSESLDRCLTISARRNDSLIRCFALMCTSAHDLEAKNYVRARVCAGQASDFAIQAQAPFLQRLTKLLQQVADYLGEKTKPAVVKPNPKDAWSVLEAMIVTTLVRDEVTFEQAARMAERISCPPLGDLILQLIIRSLGTQAELLHTTVAELWGIELPASYQVQLQDHATSEDNELLEIKMMGEFSVYLRGKRLTERVWGRSSTKALLAMLAAARGHSVTRAEVIKTIWPHGDTLAARNSVYTATAKLRQILGQNSRGEQYLLRDEALSLNEELIRCDIDEFIRDARAALTNNHTNLGILTSCEDISRRYSAELVLPKVESANFFVERQEELQTLYGDVMMAGAEAALALSMYRKAAFLAQEALRAESLREDAIYVLLQTLIAQGRISEARLRYERFARAYELRMGMMPSRSLRDMLKRPALGSSMAADTYPAAAATRTTSELINSDEFDLAI